MKKTVLLALVLLSAVWSCSGPAEKPAETGEMSDAVLRKKANELAQKFIIIDGHVDLPYRMRMEMFGLKKEAVDPSVRSEKGNFDFVRAKEGGLNAPFMSIFVPASYQKDGGAKIFADSLIDMVSKIATDYPDKFAIARSPADVEKHFAEGKISLPMGMENGAPIEDDLANVRHFYNRGIRYITLTHSKVNQICDSSYDSVRTWNGLSPFGREVVKEMNQVGIMIDISHVSDSAFFQVLKITKVPVIASHSSCRKFTPDFERNMSDEMLVKLAENGGVIQINFGSTFIDEEVRNRSTEAREYLKEWLDSAGLAYEDPKAQAFIEEYSAKNPNYSDVNVVADHIDHAVKTAGIDHVGFGSDFDGVGDTLPVGLKDVSMYPNLIYELLKRGYTDEEIEKICYKNVFRVWKSVEAAAAKG